MDSLAGLLSDYEHDRDNAPIDARLESAERLAEGVRAFLKLVGIRGVT